MNLVINARDAMPDGGRITIKTEMFATDLPKQMPGFLLRPGEYIRHDNRRFRQGDEQGECWPKMFEPYFHHQRESGRGPALE